MIRIPGEDLRHYSGLDWVQAHPAGVTRALGIQQVAMGGPTPRQELPAAQLRLPAPPHPLRNQRPFVLCHRTPNVEQELIVGITTHGAVEKLYPTPALREFVEEEDLVHVVAGQPIWGREEDTLEGGKGRLVPQPVQTRAVELGSTVAVITVNMLLRQLPVGVRRHCRPQAGQLLLNRLRMLLTVGRDSDIQGDFHGLPASYMVLVQAGDLRCRPSPTAEGIGTHNPIVARRQCRLWWYGAPAKRFSWLPPVWGVPLIQEDTGPKGLAAEPLGASPPRQREEAPTGAAKFVICDHTIEVFFRVLKQGCQIEQLRLQTPQRLVNAIAIYLIVAWRIHTITMASRAYPEVSCEVVFEPHEWQTIYTMQYHCCPPQTPPPLREMVRSLAQIGGVLARKGDGEPGIQSIWQGYQRLYDFLYALETHRAVNAL